MGMTKKDRRRLVLFSVAAPARPSLRAAVSVWLLAASILMPGLLSPSASAQTIPVEQLLASEEDPAVLTDAGRQLAAQRQPGDDRRLWEKAAKVSPGFFAALFNLGYLHFSADRHEQAAAFLTRAAKASPGDFNSRYLLGVVSLKLERREEALRESRGQATASCGRCASQSAAQKDNCREH